MLRTSLVKNLRASKLSYSLSGGVFKYETPKLCRFYAAFPVLTKEVAKERLIELLEGFDKVDKTKQIEESSSFVHDLGLDSLDVVEVIMEVEQEFNIQIPDNDADSLKTVGQTMDYVLKQEDAC